MKKLILAAALIAPMFAQADERQEYCGLVADIAGIIMTARQEGVPVREMLEVNGGKVDLGYEMVKRAYIHPQFSTPDYQQKEITEFENDWYLACINIKDEE